MTKRAATLLAAAVLACAALGAQAVTLPRPAGLEPDVRFWQRAFTEVTSSEGMLHDNRRLDIVYEVIDMPMTKSSRTRQRLADRARKRYRVALESLAGGKRENLSAIEARVLALWGEDADRATFRDAAKRLRVQQGLADQFRDGIIRSGRWRHYIRARLREAGVPAEVAALPHVESSYNPAARSHIGASGLWQFTRTTGRRFMQIDHVVDERRDPYRSSEAAAELLAYNYSILKSWPLAITAYNHGVAGMRRAQRKMGTDDIERINREYKGRRFGFASRNFYVALLAAADIDRAPRKYFGQVQRDRREDPAAIVVEDYMRADTLANVYGVSLDMLRKYNPALLEDIWIGSKYVPRGYVLRFPDQRRRGALEELMADVPMEQRFRSQTPDLSHRVRPGESLSVIARRYRTSISEIMALNGLRSRHRIRAGQTLRLPFAGDMPRAIPKGATTYTVRRGDTLGGIAQNAGVSITSLMQLNGLQNRNRIYPGQELLLAGATAQPASTRPVVAQRAEPARPESAAPQPAKPEGIVIAAPGEPPDERDGESGLLADPSDYLVAADGSIEVQAAETLGHYANWLRVPTSRLRALNNLGRDRPVVFGNRLKLDFSKVSRETFAARRVAHHRQLQEEFFTRYRVSDTRVHRLRRGESVWVLAMRRYKVPVWLLRQYNPDLDLGRVRPGTRIVFPSIERLGPGESSAPAVADAR